jgi:hypothetical protein
MSALAVLGILMVQALVCLAIIAFFRRPGGYRPHPVIGQVAPVVSLLGLLGAMVLVIVNLPLLASTDNPLIRLFPLVLVLVLGRAWRLPVACGPAIHAVTKSSGALWGSGMREPFRHAVSRNRQWFRGAGSGLLLRA